MVVGDSGGDGDGGGDGGRYKLVDGSLVDQFVLWLLSVMMMMMSMMHFNELECSEWLWLDSYLSLERG